MSSSSCRVDTVPLIPGRCVVGSTGHGVKVSDVPTTGPNGAPFGLPDITDVAATAYVRWLIKTWPSAGLLEPLEDGSFRFSGAPPGVYSFYVEAWLEGQPVKTKLVVIEFNAPTTPVSISLDLT